MTRLRLAAALLLPVVVAAACSSGAASVRTASGPAADSGAGASASPTNATGPTGPTTLPPTSSGSGPSVSPAAPPVVSTQVPAPTVPRTTVPITRQPVAGIIEVTSHDNQATLVVRVGESIELTLADDNLQWGPPRDVPTGILSPLPAPAPPPHGQRVIWRAASPGTVRVTAVGTAYCAQGVACPMFAALFSVTFVIG